MGYTHLPAGDPSIETFRGVFLKVRRALGITGFGINEFHLPAGTAGFEHDEAETGHEEVYLVLEGTGSITVDGEQVAVAPGDYVRVDAAATRQIHAGPDGLRMITVGAQPKPAYDGRASL